jgi:hypothetical protein
MPNRIVINRLVVQSPTEPDAVIEFTPGLNVISGPSDSGKSYILDLLDFMFGAASLPRRIPEIEPYRHVVMQISITGDDPLLLSIARALDGEFYELREGHVETVGIADEPRQLSRTHNARNLDNLSNFLLDKLGLSGAQLRRNARNQTRTLSFRDLAHLAIIDETSMQSEVSPVTPTGQYTTRTVEESVFSLLLEGDDDSGLTEFGPSTEERRLSETRLRLLDRVVSLLEGQSPSTAPIAELRDQLDRLNTGIASEGASIEQRLAGRDDIAGQRSSTALAIDQTTSELAELTDLYSRFLLLSRQYASDLERLDMIAEAGTLLTLTNPDVCVLCGAATEHQHWDRHQASELTSLSDAVDAEKSKIESLARDLGQTLQDVRERGRAAQRQISTLRKLSTDLTSQIRQLDASIRPDRAQLRELIHKRSSVERAVTVQEHIDAVDALRAQVAAAEQATASSVRERPSPPVLAEFGEVMIAALQAWHVQGARSVRYDRASRDFIIGGRARASRGKGVRALQHAAFSVALARYCADRDLPAPGFVILDSPLVTYREPDRDDPVWGDSAPQSTSDAFYTNLAASDAIQIIVIENVPPPVTSAVSVNHVAFTLNTRGGRVGLFPRTATVE